MPVKDARAGISPHLRGGRGLRYRFWFTETAGRRREGATGIPDDLVESADTCVEIPMVGRGASLNVAVAGSLVLYRLAGLA